MSNYSYRISVACFLVIGFETINSWRISNVLDGEHCSVSSRKDSFGGVSFTLSGRSVTGYGHGEIVVTVRKPTSGGVLEPPDSR